MLPLFRGTAWGSSMRRVASIFRNRTAATGTAPMRPRTAHPSRKRAPDSASTVGEIAPPMLPHVFITAETEPAKSPPMSSGIAHETPTVSSSPNTATHVYQHAGDGIGRERGRQDRRARHQEAGDRHRAPRQLSDCPVRLRQKIRDQPAEQIAHRPGEQGQAGVEPHLLQIEAAVIVADRWGTNPGRPRCNRRSRNTSGETIQRLPLLKNRAPGHRRAPCATARAPADPSISRRSRR